MSYLEQENLEVVLNQRKNCPPLGDSKYEKRSPDLLYAVDSDPQQLVELAEQTGYYGYETEYFSDLLDLPAAVQKKKPTAILINTSSLVEVAQYQNFIQEVQKTSAAPILYMSESIDFNSRLMAVRTGGKGLFSKPINVGSLVEALDKLTFRDSAANDPYRVLIVDDSPLQTAFASAHLRKIGAITRVLNDPTDILNSLENFSPDLIILDMYMPGTTGIEVAGIIRQMEAFVSIPIVFLSSETDRDVQLEAMSLGGDDFLTKPIKPEHLISAVLSRAERYRQLRSLMQRDSLTRLINTDTMHERLRQELLRASEKKGIFSYAIIDVDEFKKVNDTYGHAAGDLVLKNLANLLRQRLRRTDVIGRIGGEEFSIILPDTSQAEAGYVMDELRRRFAGIRHREEDQSFTCSVSCGIASFPRYSSISDLSRAADQALYEAKNRGRNRIALAGN